MAFDCQEIKGLLTYLLEIPLPHSYWIADKHVYTVLVQH